MPAGLDAEEFKTVFRHHAAAVAVVTLTGPAGPVGFTATSITSVSAEPPVLAFSVSASSSSWPALATTETVVVNFLAHNQADVAARFATPGIDRFAADDWFPLPTGEPVLENTRVNVRARILDRVAAGSSYILTLQALDHSYPQPAAGPLLYLNGTYHRRPETALSGDALAAPAT
jgi:flavin reductase (DIM6/NTAB) family NADH-FMN oxidoreductase RutF